MKPAQLLEILKVAEKLKCTTRHCYTSSGRHESVAEHSWRISLMAMLLEKEFPAADMNKVIRMCLIHDLGEAFTGDIPTFHKGAADEAKEEQLYAQWVATLPEDAREEFTALLTEITPCSLCALIIIDLLAPTAQKTDFDPRKTAEHKFPYW